MKKVAMKNPTRAKKKTAKRRAMKKNLNQMKMKSLRKKTQKRKATTKMKRREIRRKRKNETWLLLSLWPTLCPSKCQPENTNKLLLSA